MPQMNHQKESCQKNGSLLKWLNVHNKVERFLHHEVIHIRVYGVAVLCTKGGSGEYGGIVGKR